MCSLPPATQHPTDAFTSRFNSDDETADYVAVEPWATDIAHYAGRYVSDECDGHIDLNPEDDHLTADLLGKARPLRAGAEGELVTDEGIVLRVPPLSEADTFTFASWGLRGLQYRRLP